LHGKLDQCGKLRKTAHFGGKVRMAEHSAKISVLLDPAEANRFDAYCRSRGFKKSTLIARLIRDHLDSEKFDSQTSLFDAQR
jgi:macrodomain Ter protein organizer (MatP/YcbG family)